MIESAQAKYSARIRHGDVVESLYYVTALSNLVRCYDKFSRKFDKAGLPDSTFPDRFYLLRREELSIGITKAHHVPAKTGLPGDQLIAIETRVSTQDLHPNYRTGLGRYVRRSYVKVEAIHLIDESSTCHKVQIEEACALSYRTHLSKRQNFMALAPRSVSFLPVARACQARCPFCFSRASVSEDVTAMSLDWCRINSVLLAAKARGVRRAVITGGGEPSLLPDTDLQRLIRESAKVFSKVVLISNGHTWGRLGDDARFEAIARLNRSGLSVLAISRHHFDRSKNAKLKGLDTKTDELAATWSNHRDTWPGLKLRWICVLQHGGVEDRESLEKYLSWATSSGVEEICFKELYVSSSVESEYYDRNTNDWSAQNQVPLRLVLALAREARWTVSKTLPWGAPVFEGRWNGRPLRVAAYAEPSLFWELENGVARSWNLLADGRCLASLEDRNSEVMPRGLRCV